MSTINTELKSNVNETNEQAGLPASGGSAIPQAWIGCIMTTEGAIKHPFTGNVVVFLSLAQAEQVAKRFNELWPKCKAKPVAESVVCSLDFADDKLVEWLSS